MEIVVPGKIEAIATREFEQHAPLSGRIAKVFVHLGESVKAGQTLAEIESPEMNELAAQLLQSKLDTESEYEKQKANLDEEVNQAERRLELAEANMRRTQRLFDEKIAAQKDVLIATNELELAKTRLNTSVRNRDIVLSTLKSKISLVQKPLRQRLQLLGVDQQHIDRMLESQTTITSVPLEAARDGAITDIQGTPGMSIEPTVRLFTISDLSRVWATAQVFENDMSRMKVGQKVSVKVQALAGERVEGKLSSIGTYVNPQTRTLPVRAEISNSRGTLKPDMYAELLIQTSESVPVIALPRDAVVERGGHYLVFQEVSGGYQPTYVSMGRSFGDEVEIVRGIKPGDRVVVRGAFQLGAQLLKSLGGEEQFSQPTEGERSEVLSNQQPGALTLNLQTVLLIVASAFLLGFGISAVLVVRTRSARVGATRLDPETNDVRAAVVDEIPPNPTGELKSDRTGTVKKAATGLTEP